MKKLIKLSTCIVGLGISIISASVFATDSFENVKELDKGTEDTKICQESDRDCNDQNYSTMFDYCMSKGMNKETASKYAELYMKNMKLNVLTEKNYKEIYYRSAFKRALDEGKSIEFTDFYSYFSQASYRPFMGVHACFPDGQLRKQAEIYEKSDIKDKSKTYAYVYTYCIYIGKSKEEAEMFAEESEKGVQGLYDLIDRKNFVEYNYFHAARFCCDYAQLVSNGKSPKYAKFYALFRRSEIESVDKLSSTYESLDLKDKSMTYAYAYTYCIARGLNGTEADRCGKAYEIGAKEDYWNQDDLVESLYELSKEGRSEKFLKEFTEDYEQGMSIKESKERAIVREGVDIDGSNNYRYMYLYCKEQGLDDELAKEYAKFYELEFNSTIVLVTLEERNSSSFDSLFKKCISDKLEPIHAYYYSHFNAGINMGCVFVMGGPFDNEKILQYVKNYKEIVKKGFDIEWAIGISVMSTDRKISIEEARKDIERRKRYPRRRIGNVRNTYRYINYLI